MATDPLLLGSDIGTGSYKTVLLNDRGEVVAANSREYPSHHPHPDWAEQDPEDWYAAFHDTVRRVLKASGVPSAAVVSVCIVGATHNPVLLDRRGEVLRPSIHFWDRRSQAQVAEIQARWGAETKRRSCNGIDVLWTWPQLLWVRQNEPEVWARVASLLFPKDYVRHRLAPSPITDTVNPTGSHRLNYPHVLTGLWYPGSVTKYGAAAYRWARSALWPDLSNDGVCRAMDAAAAEAPPGCDGMLFHPHLLGEFAPQWNPNLRASFTGVTIHHSRPHLTRSILEGGAFQIRAALEDLREASATWNEIRLIGGGTLEWPK